MDVDNVISVLLVKEDPEYILFKTAMLFAEQGLLVWFISSKPFENLPKKITNHDKEILQQITFLYLRNLKDLITELNGIHLWNKSPSIIILSQFKTYVQVPVEDPKNFLAAFILTSLLDSAAVCSKKNKKKSLILTCTEDVSNMNKFQILFDMYFSHSVQKIDEDNTVDTIVKIYTNQ
ncbi:unnamed protein product [Callosobruchus maculatus]|uniref:Uncharacterized protein n=1 Tax=Callosobruchus maculatus TaxID=64391 RepID=A0A653C585_CALMS|nr:unnamed protein product [Callosobruchus maculatus]